MRTNHWVAATALAGLALGGAALAGAQSPPAPGSEAPGAHVRHHRGDGAMAGRMAAELGLSDEQKQRMRALRESARPEAREAAERLRTSQRKLRALSPDDPAWNASVDEASQLAAEAATRRVREGARMRAEMWRILTPEQRTKFNSLQAQREQRMKERMEKRMDERRRRLDSRPPAGRG